MKLFEPLWLALSLYSRIPAPRYEWNEKNQKAALWCLPIVGVVIGGLEWLWFFLCGQLGISQMIFAAIATVIPIAVTGGFHLDGFCDTVDALCSYQDKERALEIMKDSRVGAFAVIHLCVYFLLNFAVLYEMKSPVFAVVYVLSRIYVAVSVYAMPKINKSGLMPNFNGNFITIVILCIIFPPAIRYYRLTKKRFGGITGDTSGYFLQVSEMILLGVVLLCEKLF